MMHFTNYYHEAPLACTTIEGLGAELRMTYPKTVEFFHSVGGRLYADVIAARQNKAAIRTRVLRAPGEDEEEEERRRLAAAFPLIVPCNSQLASTAPRPYPLIAGLVYDKDISETLDRGCATWCGPRFTLECGALPHFRDYLSKTDHTITLPTGPSITPGGPGPKPMNYRFLSPRTPLFVSDEAAYYAAAKVDSTPGIFRQTWDDAAGGPALTLVLLPASTYVSSNDHGNSPRILRLVVNELYRVLVALVQEFCEDGQRMVGEPYLIWLRLVGPSGKRPAVWDAETRYVPLGERCRQCPQNHREVARLSRPGYEPMRSPPADATMRAVCGAAPDHVCGPAGRTRRRCFAQMTNPLWNLLVPVRRNATGVPRAQRGGAPYFLALAMDGVYMLPWTLGGVLRFLPLACFDARVMQEGKGGVFCADGDWLAVEVLRPGAAPRTGHALVSLSGRLVPDPAQLAARMMAERPLCEGRLAPNAIVQGRDGPTYMRDVAVMGSSAGLAPVARGPLEPDAARWPVGGAAPDTLEDQIQEALEEEAAEGRKRRRRPLGAPRKRPARREEGNAWSDRYPPVDAAWADSWEDPHDLWSPQPRARGAAVRNAVQEPFYVPFDRPDISAFAHCWRAVQGRGGDPACHALDRVPKELLIREVLAFMWNLKPLIFQ